MNNSNLRIIDKEDISAFTAFLQTDIFLHRHLDWRTPVEWLGFQPFWALEQQLKIKALLAMPDDPPGVYWVRLFALDQSLDALQTWTTLFEKCLQEISVRNTHTIAALGYQDWFKKLLHTLGWIEAQRVVLLKWHGSYPEIEDLAPGFLLRPLLNTDLDEVARIDQVSFDPLWQQSGDATRRAYAQCSYATVVEFENKVVGYQISTASSFNAHLARLAVYPDFRHKRIGRTLVQDMLQYFHQPWIHEITVNTQEDNFPSQKLYQSLGFQKTGESYPIFTFSR